MSLAKSPSVSVVIINWNGMPFVKDCIKSVYRQTYPNIREIIFVDNGSTDDSVKFVKKNFPRIKIVRNRKNLGVAEAQNIGLKKAKGDFIACIHNDNTADKNWVRELVRRIRMSGPETVCTESASAYHKLGVINGSLNVLSYNILNVHRDQTRKFYPGTGAMMIKNGVLKNYFDPEYFFYQEDVYLGWLLRLMGYNVNRAPKSIVHVLGSQSISTREIRNRFQFLAERNRLINFLIFFDTENIIKLLPLYLFSMLFRILSNLHKDSQKSLAYARAYAWVFSHLDKISRKRRAVQKLRRVDDEKITSQMTAKLLNGNRGVAGLVNSISNGYCKLVGVKPLEG